MMITILTVIILIKMMTGSIEERLEQDEDEVSATQSLDHGCVMFFVCFCGVVGMFVWNFNTYKSFK